MSDNIPFEIQMEIIKKVYDVKSLIRLRSVSKPWKSFIDSSDFIKVYGARHTHPHSCILSYKVDLLSEPKYICVVDDDIETFKVQELAPSLVSPLLEQYRVSYVVGACHGLLCLYGYNKDNERMIVIWNPCIRKSFGIAVPGYVPGYSPVYGFGVCPVTTDPTIVKILCADNMPWHVEVFTLSSGVWHVIPSGNLPRQSVTLEKLSTRVVIDSFIYWGASEVTSTNDGESITKAMVVSFDLINKEFKVLNLPDCLTNELILDVSVSKLKGSLVVYGYIMAEGAIHCGVWVMEHDLSFRKLFSIGAHVNQILWFMKNGEPIFEIYKAGGQLTTTLNVYDPCSKQVKNLGISGFEYYFFMDSYKESLLLLDQSDLHKHSDHN